jgi:uncharacterized membrane protein
VTFRVGDHASWFRFGCHQRTYGVVREVGEQVVRVVAADSDRVVELPITEVTFYARPGATK